MRRTVMVALGAWKLVILDPSNCIQKEGWLLFVISVMVNPNALNGAPKRL